MNKETGFAVITQDVGKILTYAYAVIDADGNITKNNVKESFVVMDEDLLAHVTAIETYINNKLNPTPTTPAN